MGYANRYYEDCFLQGRAGGTGDEFMEPREQWSKTVWEPMISIAARNIKHSAILPRLIRSTKALPLPTHHTWNVS
jgi:hypothetical protein